MATQSMYLGSLGSPVIGNFGTYVANSFGVATVDTRDIPALLAAGAKFIRTEVKAYGQTPAVAAGAAARLVASASLAAGAVAVANQPDVPRQGQLLIFPGTAPITAGTIALPYIANDGTLTTDTFSCVVPGTATATFFTSKGVVHLNTGTIAGVTGGVSPAFQVDTTSVLSVPVEPDAFSVTFLKETTDAGNTATGTLSTVTLASIAPTTALNATHTYGWMYSYSAPIST